jgi:hypothetical protein
MIADDPRRWSNIRRILKFCARTADSFRGGQ